MKRTNLVLDAELLEEARRMSGARTYSEAVNKALSEWVRRYKMQDIVRFMGKGLWAGDLAEMRRDNPRRRASGKRAGR